MKVGKKTPLTAKNFTEFFALLPTRGEGERSWTIGLAARKAKANADTHSFREAAREKFAEAHALKNGLTAMKKIRPRDAGAIGRAEAAVKMLTVEARDAAAKADAIINAVYDLKAVNPNRESPCRSEDAARLN